MKIWSLAASVVAALLACGQAAAQFKNPDDAIEYRQGALAAMGNHFSRSRRPSAPRATPASRATTTSARNVERARHRVQTGS